MAVGRHPDVVFPDLQEPLVVAHLQGQPVFPVIDQVQVEHIDLPQHPGEFLNAVDAEVKMALVIAVVKTLQHAIRRVHGRTLAGQVVETGGKPFKVVADLAVDLGIDEAGRLPDQPGRALFLDRFQQLKRRVDPQQPVDVHQMLAEKPVKTVAVGRKMVIAVPPEPVAPFGGVQ